jgi:hypothetical protein
VTELTGMIIYKAEPIAYIFLLLINSISKDWLMVQLTTLVQAIAQVVAF